NGTDVDNRAARRTKELDRLLSRQQQTKHIEVELLVEVARSDGIEGRELVNARVVHQHIKPSVSGLSLGEETFNVVRPGDVRLNGHRCASLFLDAADDSVGAGLTGS